MRVFLDSSVVLRKLFGEPKPLQDWRKLKEVYASRLLAVEVARTIDRSRLLGRIDDREVGLLHRSAQKLMRSIEFLGLSEQILLTASGPMPTVLGSLDAIHLASALELSRVLGARPTLATHDEQLAAGARGFGFEVIGCG